MAVCKHVKTTCKKKNECYANFEVLTITIGQVYFTYRIRMVKTEFFFYRFRL